MDLLDTTLRDGGNVVGHGFPAKLTASMIDGLLRSGITNIEFGNCKGLGAREKLQAVNAPSDEEYLELVQPYLGRGSIGMFLLAKCASESDIARAADSKLAFLRVGENAGDGAKAVRAVEMVRNAGLMCRYSQMKVYVLTAKETASEAKMLENAGVQVITLMDSAGTMFPEDVRQYVDAVKQAVSIPVGFHGHSNLGLSQANAIAAVEAGADEIDCGMLGMARSAGNCATELAVATLQKKGFLPGIDLFHLLTFLDTELIPAMRTYGFSPAVSPTDLVMGLYGCHSSFLPIFKNVAFEQGVPLLRLISRVSILDRKAPDEALIRRVALDMKKTP
jgi:4-hydroxy-2-oxovalerate aldolase